jgi:hypothetical protein
MEAISGPFTIDEHVVTSIFVQERRNMCETFMDIGRDFEYVSVN